MSVNQWPTYEFKCEFILIPHQSVEPIFLGPIFLGEIPLCVVETEKLKSCVEFSEERPMVNIETSDVPVTPIKTETWRDRPPML